MPSLLETLNQTKESVNTPVNINDKGYGDTLLGIAAANGDLSRVQLLVALGAEVNQIQSDGISNARRYAMLMAILETDENKKAKCRAVKHFFDDLIIKKDATYEWLRNDNYSQNQKHFQDNPEFADFIKDDSTIVMPDMPNISACDKTITFCLDDSTDKSSCTFSLFLQEGDSKKLLLSQEIKFDGATKEVKVPDILGDMQLRVMADKTLILENYNGLNPFSIAACGKVIVKNVSSPFGLSVIAADDVTVNGELLAKGPLQIKTKGILNNNSAKIISKHQVYIEAKELDNSAGLISSETNDVIITATMCKTIISGKIEAPSAKIFFNYAGDELIINSKLSSETGIFVTANKFDNTEEFISNGDIRLITKRCFIRANLKSNSHVMVKTGYLWVPEDKLITGTKAVYLLTDHGLQLGGKIATDGYIGLLKKNVIGPSRYALKNLTAKKLIEIKMPSVADFSFPENIKIEAGAEIVALDSSTKLAVSYELIGNDPTPIVLPNNMRFKELRIKARGNDLTVGSKEKKAIVAASRKMLLDVKSANVFNGGLFASKVLSLNSIEPIKVGYIDRDAKINFGEFLPCFPSFIACDNELLITSGRRFEVACGEVLCRLGDARFETPEIIDIGGTINICGNGYFDLDKGHDGVIYEEKPRSEVQIANGGTPTEHWRHLITHEWRHVKTRAAIIAIYKTAHFLPVHNIKIEGGQLYAGEIKGAKPTQILQIRQALVTQHTIHAGNKRDSKSWWQPQQIMVAHEQLFNGTVESIASMNVEAQNRMQMSGTLASANSLTVNFKDAVVGVTDPSQAITAISFSPLAKLFDDRPSYLYMIGGEDSATFLVPTVPFAHIPIEEFDPVVFFDGKIQLASSLTIDKRHDATKEMEKLFPQLILMLGNVNFSGENLGVLEVWRKLQQNAQQWMKENPQFKASVSRNDIENAVEPMLIYEPTPVTQPDGSLRLILDVTIALPKHFGKLKYLTGAGGWFARSIRAEGGSLELRGFIQAKEKVELELDGTLTQQPHQSQIKNTVSDVTVQKKFFRSKVTNTTREVVSSYTQVGSGIIGGSVDIKTGKYDGNGCEVTATDGDVDIVCGNAMNLGVADGIYYVIHVASGKAFLQRVMVSEALERHVIQQSRISAPNGNVNITVNDGDFTDTAVIFDAKNVEVVVKNGDRISKCAVVREDQGTTFAKRKLTLTESRIITERGVGAVFLAEQKLEQSASDNIDLTATTSVAKKIVYDAGKGFKATPQVLNNLMQSQTTGLVNPFTYLNSKTVTHFQAALQTVFAGFEELSINAEHKDIELQSVILQGQEPSVFRPTAPNGNILLTTAKLESRSQTTAKTIGFGFTASEIVSAVLQNDAKAALAALASISPLLQPVVSMTQPGNHSEDFQAQGMLLGSIIYNRVRNGTLTSTDLVKDFQRGLGFAEDATGKMRWDVKNLNFTIGVTKTHSETYTSTVLPNTIAVGETDLQAALNIELHSLNLDGKKLLIKAGGIVSIVADQEHTAGHEITRGVTVGYGGNGPSVAASYARSAQSSTTYHSTTYNLSEDIQITTSGEVEVRGTTLKTVVALIKAKRLLVESLFDLARSRQQSFSASSAGMVAASQKRFDGSWANMQATIHASNHLQVEAENSIALKGAVLSVGHDGHMNLITPEIKHEHLQGHRDGNGFSAQASGLFGNHPTKNQPTVTGTMYDTTQSQQLNAGLIGKVTATRRDGSAHKIDASGLVRNQSKTKVESEESRSGFGLGGQFDNTPPKPHGVLPEMYYSRGSSNTEGPQNGEQRRNTVDSQQDGYSAGADRVDSIELLPDSEMSTQASPSIAELAHKYFIYLKHETDCDKIEEILDSGVLQPRNRQTDLRAVFMSFSRQDYIRDHCTLIFNMDLIDSRNDYHITNLWTYGVYYDKQIFKDHKNQDVIAMSANPNDLPRLEEVLYMARMQNEEIKPNEIVFRNAVDLRYLEGVSTADYLLPNERDNLEKQIRSRGVSVYTRAMDLFNDTEKSEPVSQKIAESYIKFAPVALQAPARTEFITKLHGGERFEPRSNIMPSFMFPANANTRYEVARPNYISVWGGPGSGIVVDNVGSTSGGFSSGDVYGDETLESEQFKPSQNEFNAAAAANFKGLRHETSCENVEKIIDSGRLKKSSAIDSHGRGQREGVYFQLIGSGYGGDYGLCGLSFDVKVLNTTDRFHVSNHQSFGHFSEPWVESYDLSARPHEEANFIEVLRRIKVIRGPHEVVFYDDVDLSHFQEVDIASFYPGRDKLANWLLDRGIPVYGYDATNLATDNMLKQSGKAPILFPNDKRSKLSVSLNRTSKLQEFLGSKQNNNDPQELLNTSVAEFMSDPSNHGVFVTKKPVTANQFFKYTGGRVISLGEAVVECGVGTLTLISQATLPINQLMTFGKLDSNGEQALVNTSLIVKGVKNLAKEIYHTGVVKYMQNRLQNRDLERNHAIAYFARTGDAYGFGKMSAKPDIEAVSDGLAIVTVACYLTKAAPMVYKFSKSTKVPFAGSIESELSRQSGVRMIESHKPGLRMFGKGGHKFITEGTISSSTREVTANVKLPNIQPSSKLLLSPSPATVTKAVNSSSLISYDNVKINELINGFLAAWEETSDHIRKAYGIPRVKLVKPGDYASLSTYERPRVTRFMDDHILGDLGSLTSRQVLDIRAVNTFNFPDTYVVAIHGNPEKFTVWHKGKYVEISHRTLAAWIERQPDYFGGSIHLIQQKVYQPDWKLNRDDLCCNGIAQDLANKLGKHVDAPIFDKFMYYGGFNPRQKPFLTSYSMALKDATGPFHPNSVGAARHWADIYEKLDIMKLPHNAGEVRFIPSEACIKMKQLKKVNNYGKIGIRDADGNTWFKGASKSTRFGEEWEWDVVLSRTGKARYETIYKEKFPHKNYNAVKHLNVSLKGKLTH